MGTGLAAVLIAVAGRDRAGSDLRCLGAAGGAGLALAGVLLGILRSDRRIGIGPPGHAPVTPRFHGERRRSPRRAATDPVVVAVDGHRCEATLLNVSSQGALLRLHERTDAKWITEVGQPVTIEDHPAGTIARVGSHGIYVDFAVEFEPDGHGPAVVTAERASGTREARGTAARGVRPA